MYDAINHSLARILMAVGLQWFTTTAGAQQIITNIAIPLPSMGVVAVNPNLNKIYTATGNPSAQPMVEVDGATFAASTIGAGSSIDVDITNNNYWSSGVYSGAATVYGSSDNVVTTVPLGDCPNDVSLDAAHRLAWVGAQCGAGDDPVWAVNADTFGVVRGPIGSGGVFGGIRANPATGRAYLNSSGVSKRVTPPTFTLSTNAFGSVIGINPPADLLYALGPGGALQIIDGAPDPEVVLTNVTLPFALAGYRIGVNPALNRLYVQSTNTIMILDATSGASLGTVTLAGMTGVGDIAVDASQNRVYATAYAGSSIYLCAMQDAHAAPVQIDTIKMYAGITLSGPVGRTLRIDYRDDLTTTNWAPLATFVLPTSPYFFVDTNSPAFPDRFYRVVLLP